MSAIAYDCKYTPFSDWNNIIKNRGFHRALRLVLEVKPFGSVWAAPVCRPWICICLYGIGRTIFELHGDRRSNMVRDFNVMVTHVVIILLVAWYHNLDIFTEQPQGRLMSGLMPMREFIVARLPYSCSTLLCFEPVVIRSTTKDVVLLF